jgi:glycine/D-amino acid oxidase-like deaminating enzyme
VDVAVIGGGYTGLAAARALARAGASVVVLERETAGWGASSRNGGFVLAGFKRSLAALVATWGKASARRLFTESLEAITGLESLIAAELISCEFRRVGHITLAENAPEFAALERERDVLQSVAGHRTRLLGGSELASEIAAIGYIGGLLDEAGGSVHPARLLQGLARATVQAGGMVAERTGVEQVVRAGRTFQVRTDRGTVGAGEVLVATNGYTGPAFPAFHRRVIPVGSHIVATAPLGPDLARRLIPRSRVLSDCRHLLHYFRLSEDGRLLFGGRTAFRPDRGGGNHRAAAMLRRDMIRIFPETAAVPVEHAWSGNVAVTRDQLPHVGRFDGRWHVGGYCGHGVAMAIYLGHRVGLHLAGGSELPLLASLAFPRVPLYRGNPWFLPLVGAWYRMLDWTRSHH